MNFLCEKTFDFVLNLYYTKDINKARFKTNITTTTAYKLYHLLLDEKIIDIAMKKQKIIFTTKGNKLLFHLSEIKRLMEHGR